MKKMFLIAVGALSLTACKKETTITEENASNDTLAPAETVAEKTGYKIGDEATDFSLTGTDDKQHSLSDYTDVKGFIVICTCNHCAYAKAYAYRSVALVKKYNGLGYRIIVINPNDDSV